MKMTKKRATGTKVWRHKNLRRNLFQIMKSARQIGGI